MTIGKLTYDIDTSYNILINNIDEIYKIYDKYNACPIIGKLCVSKRNISIKKLNEKMLYFKLNNKYDVKILNYYDTYIILFNMMYGLGSAIEEKILSFDDYVKLFYLLRDYITNDINMEIAYCPKENIHNLINELQELGLRFNDLSYIKK